MGKGQEDELKTVADLVILLGKTASSLNDGEMHLKKGH